MGTLASSVRLESLLLRVFIIPAFHLGNDYDRISSFGPGELSTINGFAGCQYYQTPRPRPDGLSLMFSLAFSEELPVLHIVGGPSTTKQHERPIIHHKLGNERYIPLRVHPLVFGRH